MLLVSLLALALPLALAACTAEVSASGAGSTGVSTDVDDFSFRSLDAQYTLGRDDQGASTLEVVERFVAEFPDYDQNRGMRRSIPESYLGAPLQPDLISITDDEGNPRAQETDSEDGTFSMTSRADDYVQGAQTYVFTYTLRNVTRFFDDTDVDEFYWNVMGLDSPQPFDRITARLLVPADLAARLTGAQSCYVGYNGATQTCEIGTDAAATAADGAVVIEASATDVLPYQAFTMAVAFEKGTFTPFDGSYLASPWGWVQGVAGLGLLGSLVFAIRTRSRHLRDSPGRPTVIAEYTPPRQVDALESAVMLGKTTKAIPAEVLEQAVVGSIRIVEGERKTFGGVKLKAVLVDPSRADGDGKLLLGGLFPFMKPGTEYEFGSTDTRFSTAAQNILKLAETELTTRGLRREVPGAVRARPVLWAVLAAILVFIGGIFALVASVDPLVPVLVMIGSVLVVFVVGGTVSRKPLTAEGAEVRDHLAGLKVFIEWAEADRIRMLQSPDGAERVRIDIDQPGEMLKLYEVLLPYAVVFGQEKEWAERLAVLYGPGNSPTWYSGSAAFSAASFSSGIGSLSASSSASSSTSGGSGGGGSAGGGGGGGGTGGV